MSTVHNSALPSELSKLILVTGDPNRCRRVAERYLISPKLVNEIRSAYCYTGKYRDVLVTIMSHGMGIGSMGIYSYELFSEEMYDSRLIIRVGSCGAMRDDLRLKDLVLPTEIYSNSNYSELLGFSGTQPITPSNELVRVAHNTALKLGLSLKNVKNFTSDNFYTSYSLLELGRKTGCDVVEMENYVLGVNAGYHNKEFLSILAISDVEENIESSSALSPEERERELDQMFILGLEILVKYSEKWRESAP